MKDWDDLVAAALLGSERAPLPDLPAAGGALPLLAGQEGEGPARRLLAAAAVYALYRRAGACAGATAAVLPSPAPAGDLPPCSPGAAAHLGEILQGSMGPLLEEWLRALAATGRAVPHRWLPELLDAVAQKPALRPLVDPVLGERGRWLAAQNRAWERVVMRPAPAAAGEIWRTGSRGVRLALLQALRAADPARARELVASTWKEDRPDDRVAFLATFTARLSPDDEPFLEAALDDRREKVRVAAADLLGPLPGSRLVGRMEARLRSMLILERGLLGREKLRVELPKSLDPAMARDGLTESSEYFLLGRAECWLLQMLRAAPPARWCRAWGKTADEIVALVVRHERCGLLLEGLAVAAGRYGDAEWARAVLRQWRAAPWPSSTSLRFGGLPDLERCLALVPQQSLEDWLMPGLGDYDKGTHPHVVNILAHHRRPWSEALTRAFVQLMRQGVARLGAIGGSPRGSSLYSYPVAGLAYYASPAVAADAERGWPDGIRLHQEIDRFLTILRFRRDMLQALQ